MKRLFAILFLLSGLTGSAAFADSSSSLLPAIPQATGEPHPEGNEYWRRHHMELLKHDRDLTLRDGERDIDASLGQCFTCHAVTDDAGEPVTVESEKHFCRVCHDYAAVQVDCFMCHRSTPSEDDLGQAMTSSTKPDESSIAEYLKRVGNGQ